MASASFRNSLGAMSWTQRESDRPATTAPPSLLGQIQAYNPFSRGGYVRLPTTSNEAPGAPLPAPSRKEEEEGFFALSRWDRLLVFGACNLAAALCFILCFVLFPILWPMPRKFAVLWSSGSVLFIASWAVLMGPYTYAKHLVSGPRLPFTLVYFGSILLTLVSALKLHSRALALLFTIVQLFALTWYLVSYFPMGSTGLKFAARFGTSRVAAWMAG